MPIIAVIPLILISFFYLKSSKENKNVPLYFNDDPSDIDLLNRKQKANQVARLIKGNKSNSSLAIGIVGEWGSGKTTFMNFVKDTFKDEKGFIVINFNSWLNISVNSIINDFFNTIEGEIKIHSVDVSNEIRKYGKKVLTIYQNTVTDSLLNVINIIPEKSLSDNFNYLNLLLNSLNKKVIVIFDDLDRLQPNEVFEILKLIRNTASFDAFNYVVGYDKKYLQVSLEKNSIPFPERYYEKIFQKEFPLLPITNYQINSFIKENIEKLFPGNKEEFENLFLYNYLYFKPIITDFFSSIKNLRTAKRFLNELHLSSGSINEDIYLHDFILIKLLKFSYYDVYQLLFYKDIYLVSGSLSKYDIESQHEYGMRKLENNDSLPLFVDFKDSVLKKDICELKILNENELELVGKICNKLFDSKNRYDTNRNSIVYGNNYYRYFEDEISELDIKISEFNAFMIASLSEKIELINKAYGNGRLNGFLLLIYKVKIINEIDSRAKYEDFIKILFYIANMKSSNGSYIYPSVDNYFLYRIINLDASVFHDIFGYKDLVEFKEFFKSIFYKPKEEYGFEVSFIQFVCKNYGSSMPLNLPFNNDEVDEYLNYCFNHYSKKVTGIDDYFRHCYNLCFVGYWVQNSPSSWSSSQRIINQNKEQLLRVLIPKFFKDFLLVCIENKGTNIDGKLLLGLSKDFPLKIFGSHQNFIDYLESDFFKSYIELPDNFLVEFLSFAKEVVRTENYIPFDFNNPVIKQELNDKYKRILKETYRLLL